MICARGAAADAGFIEIIDRTIHSRGNLPQNSLGRETPNPLSCAPRPASRRLRLSISKRPAPAGPDLGSRITAIMHCGGAAEHGLRRGSASLRHARHQRRRRPPLGALSQFEPSSAFAAGRRPRSRRTPGTAQASAREFDALAAGKGRRAARRRRWARRSLRGERPPGTGRQRSPTPWVRQRPENLEDIAGLPR